MSIYDNNRQIHGIQHIPIAQKDVKLNKDVVLDAVYNDIDLATLLLQGSNSSQNAMLEHYFLFALRGEYPQGYPTSSVDYYPIDTNKLKYYLDFVVGESITVVSVVAGVFNTKYTMYSRLELMPNYDIATQTLTDVISSEGVLVPTFVIDPSTVKIVDQMHLKVQSLDGHWFEFKLGRGIYFQDYYLNIIYTKDSNPSVQRHYYYNANKGGTNIVSSKAKLLNTFFPAVVLRKNGVDRLNNDKYNPLHRSTRMLLKKVGVGLGDLQRAIKSVPDNVYLDQIYFTIAVDVKADNPFVNKYLFLYLSHIHKTNPTSKTQWLSYIRGYKPQLSKLPIFHVSPTDGLYSYRIVYSYISEEVLTGNVGEIGVVNKTITYSTPLAKTVYNGEKVHKQSPIYIEDLNNPSLILTKQINETEYVKLTVSGLTVRNLMYQTSYAVCAQLNIKETASIGIPVCVGLFYELNAKERLGLSREALALTVTSARAPTKPKGFFKKFIKAFRGIIKGIFDMIGSLIEQVVRKFAIVFNRAGYHSFSGYIQSIEHQVYTSYAAAVTGLYFGVIGFVKAPILTISLFAIGTAGVMAGEHYQRATIRATSAYDKALEALKKKQEELKKKKPSIITQILERSYAPYISVGLLPTSDTTRAIETKLKYNETCLNTTDVSGFVENALNGLRDF